MVHVQRPPNFSTAPSNPCRFPSRPPAFGFSPRLQNRLLEHVAQVRERVGHSTGLLVMATALGKTVFCILDIQRLFLAPSRRDSPVDVEQGRGCGSRSGLRGRGSGASRNGETRKRRRDAEGERASGGGCLRTEGARGPEECREGASVVQEKTRCGGKGKEAEDVEVVEETDDDVSDSGAVQERRVRGVEEDGKMVMDAEEGVVQEEEEEEEEGGGEGEGEERQHPTPHRHQTTSTDSSAAAGGRQAFSNVSA